MSISTVPFVRSDESELNRPAEQPKLRIADHAAANPSRGPIFVNGFSRGGTTLLSNILASHPDTCYVGETHHVFKGHRHSDSWWQVLTKAMRNDLLYILRQREDVFSPRLIRPRRQMSRRSILRLKRILERERYRACKHPMYSRFKAPDVNYTFQEVQNARLLSKNIDGMIYTTGILATAFPDATFVSLLRNGFALCEGHLRRGRSATESGWRYRQLAEHMSRDAEALPNYHIVRFEDLLADPLRVTRGIYDLVGLDPGAVSQVRMQRRRVMDARGNHRLEMGGDEWSVVWLNLQDLPRYLERNADRNQIVRLSDSNRLAFLAEAGPTMARLGYLPSTSPQDAAEPQVLSLEAYRESLRRSAGTVTTGDRRKAA